MRKSICFVKKTIRAAATESLLIKVRRTAKNCVKALVGKGLNIWENLFRRSKKKLTIESTKPFGKVLFSCKGDIWNSSK